jgi:hypothetical protein
MADGKYINPATKRGVQPVTGSTSTVSAGQDKRYTPRCNGGK